MTSPSERPTQQVGVYVSPSTLDDLDAIARAKGVSRSEIVRQAIRRWCDSWRDAHRRPSKPQQPRPAAQKPRVSGRAINEHARGERGGRDG